MATTSLNITVGKVFKDGHTDLAIAGGTSHVTLTWDTTAITHRQQLRDVLRHFLAQIDGGNANGLAE